MPSAEIKWRVPIDWTVVQSDGWRMRFDGLQDGNSLIGKAHGTRGRDSAAMTGILNGSIDGDELYMTIYWPDGSIGKYLGAVNGQGHVQGTSIDQRNPTSVVQWSGEPALTEWV